MKAPAAILESTHSRYSASDDPLVDEPDEQVAWLGDAHSTNKRHFQRDHSVDRCRRWHSL